MKVARVAAKTSFSSIRGKKWLAGCRVDSAFMRHLRACNNVRVVRVSSNMGAKQKIGLEA